MQVNYQFIIIVSCNTSFFRYNFTIVFFKDVLKLLKVKNTGFCSCSHITVISITPISDKMLLDYSKIFFK